MIVTTVGVKVTRKIDTGYLPYMEYLKTLGNRTAPFGTRDNANIELDVYVGAQVEQWESAELVIKELLLHAKRIVDENAAEITGIKIEQPQEAYVIDKTEVTREVAEI